MVVLASPGYAGRWHRAGARANSVNDRNAPKREGSMRKFTWPVAALALLALLPGPAAVAANAPGPDAAADGSSGTAGPPDAYVVPGDRAFPTGMALDRTT